MKNFKVKVQSYTYDQETDTYKTTVNKVYIIQRSVRRDLDTIIELQKEILGKFMDSQLSMGDLVKDNESWELLKTLASNLNVLGQKEKGFNLEEIEEDLEQICQIFLTQSMNIETGVIDTNENGEIRFKPSLISELHQLNFPLYWQENVGKYLKKQAEKEKEMEKTENK